MTLLKQKSSFLHDYGFFSSLFCSTGQKLLDRWFWETAIGQAIGQLQSPNSIFSYINETNERTKRNNQTIGLRW